MRAPLLPAHLLRWLAAAAACLPASTPASSPHRSLPHPRQPFRTTRQALRQLTDKSREFGAGPLFNQILPLLMSPTLEDQERHLLVKVIDRVLYHHSYTFPERRKDSATLLFQESAS